MSIEYFLRISARSLIAAFLLVALKGSAAFCDINPNAYVRTAIIRNADAVRIRIRGPYKILDPKTNRVLQEGRRLTSTFVVPDSGRIRVGEEEYSAKRIRFFSRKYIRILIGENERKYRGNIDFVLNKEGLLHVVNHIDVEEYVRGVLYHEASHRWPMEALKVQAVAARTYALYQVQENKEFDFDVTSDIYSQVYGGKNSERYRTNLAVKRTAGEIMTYKGKVIPAYYSATCGGFTEHVEELWKHKDIAPLRGVRCGFCTFSPHYRWKKNYRLKHFQDKLNKKGYSLGLIKEIEVLDRNKSGRIRNLKITTRDGKNIVISGKDFRSIIGPNILKSNNYQPVMQGYYVDIIGKGWGHGVGMCQWGAYGMSKQRFEYKSILEHYYPGVEFIDYTAR